MLVPNRWSLRLLGWAGGGIILLGTAIGIFVTWGVGNWLTTWLFGYRLRLWQGAAFYLCFLVWAMWRAITKGVRYVDTFPGDPRPPASKRAG